MCVRQVLELIGQGPGAGGKKRGALGPAPRDRHSRGMDDTMQQQVLALFKVGAWVNLLCVTMSPVDGTMQQQVLALFKVRACVVCMLFRGLSCMRTSRAV